MPAKKRAQPKPRRLRAETIERYAQAYLQTRSHSVAYRAAFRAAPEAEVRRWSPVYATEPKIVSRIRELEQLNEQNGDKSTNTTGLRQAANTAYEVFLSDASDLTLTPKQRAEALKAAESARKLAMDDAPSDTPAALLDWLAMERSTCSPGVREAVSPVLAGGVQG